MVTIVLAGGSADHGETPYSRAAFDFGRRVAREGWTLRTGGGSGLSIMGAATDGALSAGGRVEGVILRRFWAVRHRGLHSLRSCKTFALRKAELFEGADAGVVFPGGFGTLDELGDLLTLKQTGFTKIPLVLVDLGGYYKHLLLWMKHAGREGFLYGGSLLSVVRSPGGIIRRLRSVL
ncbi:MAG TPA: TIGR00730 family Rossman fold protein [Planctomycetota bacterium]|nr:TIGR00730 family Rossman fold protein [Planctomycetota bacterium]